MNYPLVFSQIVLIVMLLKRKLTVFDLTLFPCLGNTVYYLGKQKK